MNADTTPALPTAIESLELVEAETGLRALHWKAWAVLAGAGHVSLAAGGFTVRLCTWQLLRY